MPSTEVKISSIFDSSAAAMAEVGVDRVGDRVDVVDQDALQLVEVLPPLLEARVRMAQVRLALQREDALRLVLDDIERRSCAV